MSLTTEAVGRGGIVADTDAIVKSSLYGSPLRVSVRLI